MDGRQRSPLARAASSVATRGLSRTAALAWAKVRAGIRRNWWVHLAGLGFDLRHGVETRRIVLHSGADRARPGVHNFYERTPPGRFRRIVRASRVDPAGFAFVDVGCGKGAVLILAAR
ncbi:MAG TPA: hypothetical protein VHD91_00660, partial [Gaiellaceae bacterium]|nr:hypothetical protein [Gaiellaceae bacterium]